MEHGISEVNELKSVDVVTIQRRIAEALGDLTQEKYNVTISKIEYDLTNGAHIELKVLRHIDSLGPFSKFWPENTPDTEGGV